MFFTCCHPAFSTNLTDRIRHRLYPQKNQDLVGFLFVVSSNNPFCDVACGSIILRVSLPGFFFVPCMGRLAREPNVIAHIYAVSHHPLHALSGRFLVSCDWCIFCSRFKGRLHVLCDKTLGTTSLVWIVLFPMCCRTPLNICPLCPPEICGASSALGSATPRGLKGV